MLVESDVFTPCITVLQPLSPCSSLCDMCIFCALNRLLTECRTDGKVLWNLAFGMYSSSRSRPDLAAHPALVQPAQPLQGQGQAQGQGQSAGLQPLQPAFRSPRRVTITLPFATYTELQQRADDEGRSLSNLAAFLLETSLRPPKGSPGAEAGGRGPGTGLR